MAPCCFVSLRASASAAPGARAATRTAGDCCSTSPSSSSSLMTTPLVQSPPTLCCRGSSRVVPAPLRHRASSAFVSRASKKGDKGFGTADSGNQNAPVKLSKRGTVASRGGQMSKKEIENQQEAFNAIERGEVPSTESLPPSLRAPGEQNNRRLPPNMSSTSTPLGSSNSNFRRSSSPEPTMREVSPVVNNRMFRRILAFSGVPIACGIALLPAFYYVKKVAGIDLPTWVVYAVQSFAWGGGLAGISYGILSSSWDPEREGTLLGGDEFRANLGALLERGRERR